MTRARDYDLQYRCQVCQQWKVVPGLARACEDRHAREEAASGRAAPDAGPSRRASD